MLNGQAQRADIVVVDPQAKPWLVVECKAPEVSLSGVVLDQVVRYNSVIGAPLIILTNGRALEAYSRRADGRYEPVEFPL